jgi:hypothetical protein
MQLSVGSSFFRAKRIHGSGRRLEHSLEFLHSSSGDSCKVCGWVGHIGSDLVDRNVGYVMSEEGVQLGVSLRTDTISDLNGWMYWSSLLHGSILRFSWELRVEIGKEQFKNKRKRMNNSSSFRM